MSCEIYPTLNEAEIAQISAKSAANELTWLINEIITPELPSIQETLLSCKNYLTQDDESKLPLTSTKSETLKGIIVRNSQQITKLEFILRLKNLNKNQPLKLALNTSVVLAQIVDSINSIERALATITGLIDEPSTICLAKLVDILDSIKYAKHHLKIPNPDILFPNSSYQASWFEPELPANISIDLFVNNSDISLEVTLFDEVLEKPWCDMDANGISHIDQLRENLKNDRRMSINSILRETPSNDLPIDNNTGVINNFLKNFKKYKPIDYLTKGITFNGKVVIVVEKLEVTSSDPKLLITSTKLDSLEHMVTNLYNNLKLVQQ